MSRLSTELLQQAEQARREKRFADACRDLEQAVQFLREEGPPQELAVALRTLGEAERALPDLDAARRHYEEAIDLLRQGDDPLRLAHTIRHLGDIHTQAGRYEQAEPCYREALALYRQHTSVPDLDLANAIRSFAALRSATGSIAEATALWEEAYGLYVSTQIAAGVAESAARLADLAHQAGEGDRSRRWSDVADQAKEAGREAEAANLAPSGADGGEETVTLYRPTGPKELELVEASGFHRWPPRLREQPIFYPVTNEEYAAEIAGRWNVPESGKGYVTRFAVRKAFMDRYPIQKVGGAHHTEWWVPAEDLEELNDNIVGTIEVIREITG
jgi:tetratricopeptide (TPR) repeat protein